VNRATILRLAAHAHGTSAVHWNRDLLGWFHHDAKGDLYVCAKCAGEMLTRGHSLTPATPLWRGDTVTRPWVCVVCAARLAAAFCAEIRATLTPDELDTAVKRNRTIRAGCCASHDFCDANVCMIDAWQKAFGFEWHSVEDGDENDPVHMARIDAETELCNEAWDAARESEFTLQEVQP
jgi:hypothetical protein